MKAFFVEGSCFQEVPLLRRWVFQELVRLSLVRMLERNIKTGVITITAAVFYHPLVLNSDHLWQTEKFKGLGLEVIIGHAQFCSILVFFLKSLVSITIIITTTKVLSALYHKLNVHNTIRRTRFPIFVCGLWLKKQRSDSTSTSPY